MMMVACINLAGRRAVAEKRLASMKTHQNTWKVVQASLSPAVP